MGRGAGWGDNMGRGGNEKQCCQLPVPPLILIRLGIKLGSDNLGQHVRTDVEMAEVSVYAANTVRLILPTVQPQSKAFEGFEGHD